MKRSPKLTAALSVLLVSSSYGQSQRTPRLSDNDIELEVQQALPMPRSWLQYPVRSQRRRRQLYGNVRTNDEKTLAEAKITNLRGVKSINDLLTVIDRTPPPVAASAPIPVAPKTVTIPRERPSPFGLPGKSTPRPLPQETRSPAQQPPTSATRVPS